MSAGDPEIERHADYLDRAADLTQKLTDAYVDNARRRGAPEQVQNPDGSWPVTECECGEPLGGRAALGRILCLSCQSDKEREARCSRQ